MVIAQDNETFLMLTKKWLSDRAPLLTNELKFERSETGLSAARKVHRTVSLGSSLHAAPGHAIEGGR